MGRLNDLLQQLGTAMHTVAMTAQSYEQELKTSQELVAGLDTRVAALEQVKAKLADAQKALDETLTRKSKVETELARLKAVLG